MCVTLLLRVIIPTGVQGEAQVVPRPRQAPARVGEGRACESRGGRVRARGRATGARARAMLGNTPTSVFVVSCLGKKKKLCGILIFLPSWTLACETELVQHFNFPVFTPPWTLA